MKLASEHITFNSYEKFNRVLYGGHDNDISEGKFFTFAGDTPLFMGVASDYVKDTWCYQAKNGLLMSGLAMTPGHVEGGSRDLFSKWFHESADMRSSWHHGYLTYEFSALSGWVSGVHGKVEIYPLFPGDGYCVHYEITPEQRMIFCAGFGGITPFFGRFEYHHSARRDFATEDCEGNQAELLEDSGSLKGPLDVNMLIGCDFDCEYFLDSPQAMLEKHPSMFLTPHEGEKKIIKIVKKLAQGETFKGNIVVLRNGTQEELKGVLAQKDLPSFLRGKIREKYADTFLSTPDSLLDDTFHDTIIAQDAAFHRRSFFHGAIGYHAPFLGWRGWYAPAILGWAERVRSAVKSHFDSILHSDKEEKVWWDGSDRPELDHEGTQYHHLENTSGRLPALLFKDDIYDMQEVAVDMTLYYLEHSNDMELCALIYDRLCEVLDWEERILDPDGDGLYQNFLNTWISDGHSYNGAGCAQASSYNYAANKRTALLGRKLGKDVSRLEERAAKIYHAFREKLWVNEKGLVAESMDTIGNKLRHESPELSTIYLAIDCGNLDRFQNYRMLKWAERNLETRETPVRKGKLYYSSNWQPKKYSTKGLFSAENACLALAYFQNGEKEKGWEILKGLADAFILSPYPGSITHVLSDLGGADGGDIDFTDVSSTYLRLLLEGLWGIRFMLSDGQIFFKPQLPDEWENASLSLPEISVSYGKKKAFDSWSITCEKEAEKVLQIPLRKGGVDQIFLNGKMVDHTIIPGFESSFAQVRTKGCPSLLVQVYYKDIAYPVLKEKSITAFAGNREMISLEGGTLEEFLDPAGILEVEERSSNMLQVRIKEGFTGSFDCFIRAKNGEMEVFLPLEFKVEAPLKKVEKRVIAENIMLDIGSSFNASLKEIHNQKFLSPRPENYSIGMRLNGRYAWEWNHYGHNALIVEDTLLRECGGSFTTPSGIPFATPEKGNNCVAVSLWDNFPTKKVIPLSGKGKELALLLCGTTHAMQSYIVNGRVIVTYKDGSTEELELIPPVNFDDFLLGAYQKENETIYFGNGTHGMCARVTLDPEKELESLTLEAIANEVIIDLLSVTLRK